MENFMKMLLFLAVFFGASESRAGGFKMIYGNPKNPRYVSMQEEFKTTKLLEGAISELNQTIDLPQDIPVTFQECGQANAFYSPTDKQITICFELADLFTYSFAPELLPKDALSFDQKFSQALKGAGNAADKAILDAHDHKFGMKRVAEEAKRPRTKDMKAARQKIRDSLVFVFYHEAGHCLANVLALPITGKEEDAVDQLAARITIGQGQIGQIAAVNAATGFLSFDPGFFGLFQKSTFADEHSLGQQRFFNILCWVYGSDQNRWVNIVASGTLPEERAQRCPGEYAQLARSWDTLLASHMRSIFPIKLP
jgi:hypothetical protein